MPEWRAEIRARLASLRLRPERETEIVEELAQHVEDRYREALAAGHDDARAAEIAAAELENAEVLGRELAAVEASPPSDLPAPGSSSRGSWPAALWHDVRHALRTLRRQPLFTATVLVALALSIGPLTAIASFSNWLFWRPLPGVTNPDGLAFVWFGYWKPTGALTNANVSYFNIAEIRRDMKSAVGFAGVQEYSARFAVGDGEPRAVGLAEVTADFFDVLGVRMAAGRAFRADEDRPPLGAPVVIVTEELAIGTFGSPHEALDKRVVLNRRPFTIIGVTPRGFRGVTSLSTVEAWITGASQRYLTGHGRDDDPQTRGGGRFAQFVARLAPGADSRQLEAELSTLAVRLAHEHPGENDKFRAVRARVFPKLGLPVLARHGMTLVTTTMFTLGGVLLLLGCANVANVLVARAIRRAPELAVRQALGASLARLIQSELVLAWLLALGGAVLGLGIAEVLKRLIQQVGLQNGPAFVLPTDHRVLAVTVAAAVLTGTLAGLAPAWLLMRRGTDGALARSGSGRTATRAPRLRSALASVQLAFSLALLVCALLLAATLRNLRALDLGFDAANLTVLRIDFEDHGYTRASAVTYQEQLGSALDTAIPTGATIAQRAPFDSSSAIRIHPRGAARDEVVDANSNGVAHDYFATLETPIVAGRAFTAEEAFAPSPIESMPVILSETLARRLFGDADPIGQTIHLPRMASHAALDLPVVGVAHDSRWKSLIEPPEPFLYQPLGRYLGGPRNATIIVRSSLSTGAVTTAVRDAAARIDPAVLVTEGRPLSARIDRTIQPQRLFARLVSWLGALAFVLAAVGLHGLVAQTAAERTREFGIRLAIGATRAEIARLVTRHAAAIVAIGSAGGLALAAAAGTVAKRILFGVTPVDPAVYATSLGIMAAVVAAASAWPAYRATRVEPVEVLRAE